MKLLNICINIFIIGNSLSDNSPCITCGSTGREILVSLNKRLLIVINKSSHLILLISFFEMIKIYRKWWLP